MRILKLVLVIGMVGPTASAVAAPVTKSSSTMMRASEGSHDEVSTTATDEKVICRRDKATGSRLGAKRTCMTAKQWAEKTAQERQFIEQGQAQRTFTTPPERIPGRPG